MWEVLFAGAWQSCVTSCIGQWVVVVQGQVVDSNQWLDLSSRNYYESRGCRDDSTRCWREENSLYRRNLVSKMVLFPHSTLQEGTQDDHRSTHTQNHETMTVCYDSKGPPQFRMVTNWHWTTIIGPYRILHRMAKHLQRTAPNAGW